MKEERKTKFALVTYEGTAASETCLCGNHMSESNIKEVRAKVLGDIDLGAGFQEVTDNDFIACIVCGHQ